MPTVYTVPSDRAANVKVPTLVVAGTQIPWMRQTAHEVADAIPDGRVEILDGQGHDVDMGVLAPVLTRFFEA